MAKIGSIAIGLTLAFALSGVSQAESSFRGFTMSETVQSLEQKAQTDGYTVTWKEPLVKTDDNDRQAVLAKRDKNCADFMFSAASKITRIRFIDCFFDAEDLSLKELTQSFVDRYAPNAEMSLLDNELCKGSPFQFSGRTFEGELFQIFEAPTFIECVVVINISPGSGKTPKF